MKTYIVYQDEHTFHFFDFADNKFFDFPKIKDAKLDDKDFFITCSQEFIAKNRQIDICVVEKMIYFPGPKNLQRLHQKYTHKSFEDKNKIKSILRAIHTVYKRQQPLIKELLLGPAIMFNSEIAGTMAYINSGHITIKDSFIENYNKEKESLNYIGQIGKNDLIGYMKSKNYKYHDLDSGKYILNHKHLLSFNDEALNRHVEVSSKKSEHLHLSQFAHKQLDINHKSYGAVTGRISTSNPNIQGINPANIEGNIWSFDFTGFEIMIYLASYKKSIIDDFINSNKKDIYGFIFWELFPDKYGYDSDEFKTRNPDARNILKDMCIKTLYGASLSDVKYMYGDKVETLYKKIYKYMDVGKPTEDLLNYAKKSRRYLLNRKYKVSVSDEDIDIFARLLPEANKIDVPMDSPAYYSDDKRNVAIKAEFHEIFAKERGILLEVRDKYIRIKKHLLNYNIQGTGAVIIKLAAKYAIMSKMKSKILILRHDEIIADISTENDKREIVYAMEDACKEVLGYYINIEMKKV